MLLVLTVKKWNQGRAFDDHMADIERGSVVLERPMIRVFYGSEELNWRKNERLLGKALGG
jgi:hypothetical protein